MSSSSAPLLTKLKEEIQNLMTKVITKKITGKLAIYIINHIIIPIASYRLLVCPMKRTELESIAAIWMSWVKTKFILPKSFPNGLLTSLSYLHDFPNLVLKRQVLNLKGFLSNRKIISGYAQDLFDSTIADILPSAENQEIFGLGMPVNHRDRTFLVHLQNALARVQIKMYPPLEKMPPVTTEETFHYDEMQQTPFIIYTDGSLQKQSHSLSSAFIVLENGQHQEFSYAAKVYGQESSLTAELYAIYMALNYIPERCNVKLFTDSKSAICLLNYAMADPQGFLFKTLDHPNASLLFNLYQTIQPKTIQFSHVKAHAGNFFNELVDSLASQGHTREDTLNLSNRLYQPISLSARSSAFPSKHYESISKLFNELGSTCEKEIILLKLFPASTTRQHSDFLSHLAGHLQNLIRGKYLATSFKDNNETSFILKLIAGQLPVNQRNFLWDTQAVHQGQCPICRVETESQEHFMECGLSEPTLFRDWQTNLEKLVTCFPLFLRNRAWHGLILDKEFKSTAIPSKRMLEVLISSDNYSARLTSEIIYQNMRWLYKHLWKRRCTVTPKFG